MPSSRLRLELLRGATYLKCASISIWITRAFHKVEEPAMVFSSLKRCGRKSVDEVQKGGIVEFQLLPTIIC